MGPKKPAAADGEAEDISCDLLMKLYRKNCTTAGIETNKQIKAAFDTDWVENLIPIKKVSRSSSKKSLTVSHVGRNWLVRYSCANGSCYLS